MAAYENINEKYVSLKKLAQNLLKSAKDHKKEEIWRRQESVKRCQTLFHKNDKIEEDVKKSSPPTKT